MQGKNSAPNYTYTSWLRRSQTHISHINVAIILEISLFKKACLVLQCAREMSINLDPSWKKIYYIM
jgi:hypothetical protein